MQWKLASLLFNKCEVNELGDIRTTKTKKIRKKYLDKRHKRFYISITYEGKVYTRKIARIVATEHIPNPLNLPEVNHLNGIKTDDKASNLEWSTKIDNIRHAYKTGLMASREFKLDKEKVAQIKLKILEGNNSLANIAREYEVSRNTISKIKPNSICSINLSLYI